MSTLAVSTFVHLKQDTQIGFSYYLLYFLFVLDYSFVIHVLLSMFLNATIVGPSYLTTLVIWPP